MLQHMLRVLKSRAQPSARKKSSFKLMLVKKCLPLFLIHFENIVQNYYLAIVLNDESDGVIKHDAITHQRIQILVVICAFIFAFEIESDLCLHRLQFKVVSIHY